MLIFTCKFFYLSTPFRLPVPAMKKRKVSTLDQFFKVKQQKNESIAIHDKTENELDVGSCSSSSSVVSKSESCESASFTEGKSKMR